MNLFVAPLRQRCLPVCLLLLISIFVVPTRTARATIPSIPKYRLRFFHTHTGERLAIVYRRGNNYIPEALARLDTYLGDQRTGDARPYDPRVFDLLHELIVEVGHPDAEIDVVCGYRTPWSNEFLRAHGRGVARHSLHMRAMAIDIRVPGVKTTSLRDAALGLHRGGVGYYASSDFVHVDVGRVRRW